jgi:hypothetical protein
LKNAVMTIPRGVKLHRASGRPRYSPRVPARNSLQYEFLLITQLRGNAYITHVCRSQSRIDSNPGATWPGQIPVQQLPAERHPAKLISGSGQHYRIEMFHSLTTRCQAAIRH